MIIAGAALGGLILGWFVRGWVTDLGARANARMVVAMFGRAGAISQALREDRKCPTPGCRLELGHTDDHLPTPSLTGAKP